uniref:Uncharacterized protein n=1 Tax=Podoviridae sp. ctZkC8 TaxID=2825259 RepID=A0A8S5UBW2_9CAUD|nr:MAG TPA: hypothetical protein [Podoviridae sp. ctZkC8]
MIHIRLIKLGVIKHLFIIKGVFIYLLNSIFTIVV